MVTFRQTLRELEHRADIFVNLPLASLVRLKLQQRLDAIGRSGPAAAS
jgi:arsenate reductase